MARVLKQPSNKPIDGASPEAPTPLIESMLRRLERPYRPDRRPWLISLVIVGFVFGGLAIYLALRTPALDPSKPPPLPPINPDAEKVYLIDRPDQRDINTGR